MTVQVLYKNKLKSSNIGVVALFTEEKFQIKNTDGFLSKKETFYVEKILKNKKNTKENIISFNINEKSTLILISLKKDLKSFDVENLGAEFYNFIKKKLVVSNKNFLKINFFIEMCQFSTYITFQPKVYM